MPRTAVLSLAACVSALHVQRRHLLTPLAGAASALVAPTTANAGLIDFDPEAAKAAGRARAEERRAAQKEFTDKLSTLGGVEGQVSTVGGASAVESREKGSGGTVPCRILIPPVGFEGASGATSTPSTRPDRSMSTQVSSR